MKRIITKSAVIAGLLMIAGTADAAGFQLNEYSNSNLGRAFAGMGAVGDDFSAIGYNPAGMSFNKTNGAQIGATAVSIYSDFKGRSYPDDSVHYDTSRITRVLPSGFMQYKLNDKTTVGLGVYAPFGLATDYENDWFGNEHGTYSSVSTVNVSPAVSYQINDYVSFGAAVNMQYIKARLTSDSSDLEGDDWAAGYSVGLGIKPIDSLRIGLSYRSKVSHKLKGDVSATAKHPLYGITLPIEADISAKITTPETALLSIAYDINKKWTVSGSARWTRWKRFDTLDIMIDKPKTVATPASGSMLSSTKEKWRNTGFFSLGVDYRYNDAWTFRGGVAYDMTVIRSAAHRTPRIPDGRRVWTSLGLSYTHDNVTFDVGYSHIFIYGGRAKGTDDASILKNHRPDIKYSSNADLFGVGFQYKF